jgi:hypothetical protein
MTLLLNIILFPLDLLKLTVDSWRICLDRRLYQVVRLRRNQPCIHCKNLSDCGYNPRPLPPGLRRYRNRRLAFLIQPCIKKALNSQGEKVTMCNSESAYIQYPARIHWICQGLTLIWICIGYVVVRVLYPY